MANQERIFIFKFRPLQANQSTKRMVKIYLKFDIGYIVFEATNCFKFTLNFEILAI